MGTLKAIVGFLAITLLLFSPLSPRARVVVILLVILGGLGALGVRTAWRRWRDDSMNNDLGNARRKRAVAVIGILAVAPTASSTIAVAIARRRGRCCGLRGSRGFRISPEIVGAVAALGRSTSA